MSVFFAEWKKKKKKKSTKTPTNSTFVVYMSGWHNLPYCLPEQLHGKSNKPQPWPANHPQWTPNRSISPTELPPHLSFF